MPQPGIRRIDQDRLRRLPVPHLPPRIPGISQDRRDRPQRPPGTGPVQVTSRVGRGRARHPGIVQRPGDPRGGVPGQPLAEHPRHDRRRHRIRLEPVRSPSPRRVRLVRVRPGIREPVPVRRAPAQVPALLQRLRGHRGPHPDPGPGDLPLRRQPERHHGLLMVLRVPVHPPAHFGHPQRDTVMLKQRGHRRILASRRTPAHTPRSPPRPSPAPDPPAAPPGQRPAAAAPTEARGTPPYRRTPP